MRLSVNMNAGWTRRFDRERSNAKSIDATPFMIPCEEERKVTRCPGTDCTSFPGYADSFTLRLRWCSFFRLSCSSFLSHLMTYPDLPSVDYNSLLPSTFPLEISLVVSYIMLLASRESLEVVAGMG